MSTTKLWVAHALWVYIILKLLHAKELQMEWHIVPPPPPFEMLLLKLLFEACPQLQSPHLVDIALSPGLPRIRNVKLYNILYLYFFVRAGKAWGRGYLVEWIESHIYVALRKQH